MAVWLDKKSKQHERGIFRQKWRAIPHGFGGALKVLACCEPTIVRGILGFEDHPIMVRLIFRGHLADKRVKHSEQGILRQNWCVIDHSFGVCSGSGRTVCQKLIEACQGDWRSSHCGPFNFLGQFGWINRQIDANGAFSGQIGVL